MQITVCQSDAALGAAAAEKIAQLLNAAIATRGAANLLLSTGASQFSTFEGLLKADVNWGCVTMFHLDEYIGLDVGHKASFQKYLAERFTTRVALKRAVFVNGLGNVQENIAALNADILRHPIDVGVIGIGENGHIAFNDPPADFEADAPFHIVTLNAACKQQQVNEGWFETVQQVPPTAISITPRHIMRCAHIVSPVPGQRKAAAIAAMLASPQASPMLPATLMKEHPSFQLFLDENSAAQWQAAQKQ